MKPLEPLELVSLCLDILLVVATVIAYMARPRIGGELAKGMRVLLTGVVVLGFAHLIETGMFVLLNENRQINEVIHRLLVGSGIVFVIVGFNIMRRAFDG